MDVLLYHSRRYLPPASSMFVTQSLLAHIDLFLEHVVGSLSTISQEVFTSNLSAFELSELHTQFDKIGGSVDGSVIEKATYLQQALQERMHWHEITNADGDGSSRADSDDYKALVMLFGFVALERAQTASRGSLLDATEAEDELVAAAGANARIALQHLTQAKADREYQNGKTVPYHTSLVRRLAQANVLAGDRQVGIELLQRYIEEARMTVGRYAHITMDAEIGLIESLAAWKDVRAHEWCEACVRRLDEMAGPDRLGLRGRFDDVVRSHPWLVAPG